MVRVSRLLRWLAPRGLLVTVLGLIGAWHLLHLSVSPVLTGSMAPTFRPGDVVVTQPVPTRSLRVGEVVVVVPPGEQSAFAHRIIAISGPAEHPTIRTQGDANTSPDRW